MAVKSVFQSDLTAKLFSFQDGILRGSLNTTSQIVVSVRAEILMIFRLMLWCAISHRGGSAVAIEPTHSTRLSCKARDMEVQYKDANEVAWTECNPSSVGTMILIPEEHRSGQS